MNSPLYRPPAEANSLILQVDEGCPYNRCTFCPMYKDTPYQRRPIEDIRKMVAMESHNSANRIFLADGDVMLRPFYELSEILSLLNETFPRAQRISTYATGTSITTKTAEELAELRELKLHTLYMGLESGDDDTLQAVKKKESAETMIQAGILAQSQGLRMSVMVLLGLAGEEGSTAHASNTASALTLMQPRLLSFLRVVPAPGTEFFDRIKDGTLKQLSELGVIKELKIIVAGLELKRTVLRANHSSNVVPIEARLPHGKLKLLQMLDHIMDSGKLDPVGPGRMPFSL